MRVGLESVPHTWKLEQFNALNDAEWPHASAKLLPPLRGHDHASIPSAINLHSIVGERTMATASEYSADDMT